MKFKELVWREYKTKEYRTDISLKGLFGVRFQYGRRFYNNTYYYYYIINGKKFGDYSGFDCDDLEHGKRLCEEKYIEICNQIINSLCDTNI